MPIQTRRSASKQGNSSSPGVQTRSRAASAAAAPRAEAQARRKRKHSPASIPRQSRKKSEDQSPQQAGRKAAAEVKQQPTHPITASGADEAGPSKPATPNKRASQKKASKDTGHMADEAPAEQGDDARRAANAANQGSEQELADEMGAASNALQGLLRKIGGAAFDDGMPGGGLNHSRFKSILVALREADDEGSQLTALHELCEMLAISTEESLSVFPVDQVIPILVNLLQVEHNADMMLLAARALTFLADVMPASAASIVRHGAVQVLCSRLLAIEYIDLAEQSLQALEKLSHEHPQAVLRQGGLMAVLSFLDFFQTSVQRVAVATAAAMCRGLSADSVEAVSSAVPILTNILQYEDAKVVDHACTALSRIAESYARYPDRLDMLCNHGLISNAVQLVAVSESGSMVSQLNVSTYYGLIKLLATCAGGSASVAETLLSRELPDTLRRLLRTSTLFSSSATSSASVLRTNDQLLEVVSLVAKILPPVPTEAAVPAATPVAVAAAAVEAQQGGKDAAADRQSAQEQRVQFLQQNAGLLEKFSRDLLPSLLHVYASTVQQQVRTQVLTGISRIVYYNSSEMLRALLEDLEVSSFVAGLLNSGDGAIVAAALQLAQLLMAKLPDVFRVHFVKEGVVHAIDKLAASAPVKEEKADEQKSPAAAAAQPEQRPVSGTGERSRRSGSGQRSRRLTRSASKPDAEAMQADAEAGAEDEAARAQLEAATQAAAAAAAALEKARRDPAEEQRKQNAVLARSFKAEHFSGAAAHVDTDGMKHLRELCSRLSKEGAVAALLAAMQSDSNISSFEFLNSGTVHQLKDYLLGKDLNGPKRQRKHLARIQAFTDAALNTSGSNGTPPLLALVRKLQAALASVEDLPVLAPMAAPAASYRFYGGSYGQYRRPDPGSLQSGLAALAQPFKLRLCKAPGAPQSLRDYSSNVVLIEPLATMSAIEDFLWPRVYRSPAEIAAEEAAAARRAQMVKDAAEAQRQQQAEQAAGRPNTRGALHTAAAGASEQQPQRRLTRSASSKAQAIPDPPLQMQRSGSGRSAAAAVAALASAERRMTRAASRAASEAGTLGSPDSAEAALMAAAAADRATPMDEDDPSPRGTSADGASTEHEDDLMLQDDGEEYDEEHDGMNEDDHELLDEDDVVDGASDGSDDAARMGIQTMQVHEVQLGSDGASDGGTAAATTPMPAVTAAAVPAAAAAAAPDTAAPATARQLGHTGSAPAAAQAASREAAGAGAAAGAAASYAQAAMTGTRAGAEAAARAAGEPPPPVHPNLSFSTGSQRLTPPMSIFQAVQLARQEEGQNVGGDPVQAQRAMRRMWEDIHTLHYSLFEEAADGATATGGQRDQSAMGSAPQPPAAVKLAAEAGRAALAELLTVPDLSGLGISSTTADLLTVLTLLDSINRSGPHLAAYQRGTPASSDAEGALLPPGRVSRSEFTSNKLAPKLAQQLKDVLAICGGTLPAWTERLVFGARFLFPFALRRAWFKATALGLPRALAHLQAMATAEGSASQDQDRDDRSARVGRLTRQKVRVSRKRILESAAKVMELYANSRAVLELEFFGEVGTGLGPTLEFYTLLAHELQRKSLGLWRSEGGPAAGDGAAGAGKPEDVAHIRAEHRQSLPMQSEVAEGGKASAFVAAPQGLFPAPLPPSRQGSRLLPRFTLLGRAAAKALQDGRMLDVPLSYTFYRIALGHSVDLFDVRKVDAGLGATLEKLAAASGASGSGGRHSAGPLIIDGVPIEDLCLSFVLPGYSEYELRSGGADITIDSSNCAAYVAAVVDATLGSGIARQVAAFRAGFEEVFPLRHLNAFYEDEVEAMLCGTGEKWTAEMLGNTIKFDHGYGRDSAVIGHFLRLLASLDSPDQRRFLRFVTGSPRLPPGGLAALQPRLTVVRKHSAASGTVGDGSLGSSLGASLGTSLGGGASTACDGDLPSVMTCANYIKLPPYSSYEVLRERVLFAVREGQGSFDLS